MSAENTHHVTVRMERDYAFVAEFPDRADGAAMLFDERAPLGGDRAPNAAAVLAAAVGDCLATSLAFCLRRARIEPAGLTAQVSAHLERNDRGRIRITGIDVELEPEVSDDDVARLDRCTDLFQDFCVVTESVRKGIPVNVSVKTQVPDTVRGAGCGGCCATCTAEEGEHHGFDIHRPAV